MVSSIIMNKQFGYIDAVILRRNPGEEAALLPI
jgi:hypothetical protein